MLKQRQLISDPQKGDCLRACIANLLELPLMTVPHFALAEGETGGHPTWWMDLQAWLRMRGFFFLTVYFQRIGDAATIWTPLPFEGLCMFTGFTNHTAGKPKKDRWLHMVIGKVGAGPDGDLFEQLFDPLPQGSGLESIESVSFLVPLDPASMRHVRRTVSDHKRIEGVEYQPNPEYETATHEMDLENGQIRPRLEVIDPEDVQTDQSQPPS